MKHQTLIESTWIKASFFVLLLLPLVSCFNENSHNNSTDKIVLDGEDSIVDVSKLLGKDYRLFQNTPLWTLAKAVKQENLAEIKRITSNDSLDLNYQEPKYGMTLLMLTVMECVTYTLRIHPSLFR